ADNPFGFRHDMPVGRFVPKARAIADGAHGYIARRAALRVRAPMPARLSFTTCIVQRASRGACGAPPARRARGADERALVLRGPGASIQSFVRCNSRRRDKETR